MLKFRLIARLDIRNQHLIKTIRLEGVRRVGDPAAFAERYDAEQIDEIYYNDCVASLYGRNVLGELVRVSTERCFCPTLVGGGVSDVHGARHLLVCGADKIAINTAATKQPELITEVAHKFGSQAMVIQIDAKRKAGTYEAYCEGGRQPTGREVVGWAREAVERGAGEVLLTSIDREGTKRGVDLDLAARVSETVRVPVVVSGGVGSAEHVVQAAQTGVSGVAMAGVLHYGLVSLQEIREALAEAGVPVRMAA